MRNCYLKNRTGFGHGGTIKKKNRKKAFYAYFSMYIETDLNLTSPA